MTIHIDQKGRVVEAVVVVDDAEVGCTSRCRKYCVYYSRTREYLLGSHKSCKSHERPTTHIGCADAYYIEVKEEA